MNPRSPADKTVRQRREEEAELDRGLRDSFPASDPVAISQPTTATPERSNYRLAKAGDATRRKIAGIRKPAPRKH